jgi:hypothetical protein
LWYKEGGNEEYVRGCISVSKDEVKVVGKQFREAKNEAILFPDDLSQLELDCASIVHLASLGELPHLHYPLRVNLFFSFVFT